MRDNDDLSPRLWHGLRLLLLVDADIVCVLLSASGHAVSGQRNCLAVSGELNVPMNGDRSTPAGILLDRVLIDAFERKFPGIRSFGLVETSVEVVVVDFNRVAGSAS